MRDEAVSPSCFQLEDLLALYEGPAALMLYDEAVTERDHALQCAAFAIADGRDDATVAAALLHDVGHLLPGSRLWPTGL